MIDDMPRYRAAASSMNSYFSSTDRFIVQAMAYLSNRFGDLHVEFHSESGWQVSTCYSAGAWSEDGWLSGDGSIQGCLLAALEKEMSEPDELSQWEQASDEALAKFEDEITDDSV